MRFFNLQSKKTIVGWSLFLSVVVNMIVVAYFSYGNDCWVADLNGQFCMGWPVAVNSPHFGNQSGLTPLAIDLLVWFFVSMLALYVFSRLKNRSHN